MAGADYTGGSQEEIRRETLEVGHTREAYLESVKYHTLKAKEYQLKADELCDHSRIITTIAFRPNSGNEVTAKCGICERWLVGKIHWKGLSSGTW